jgi:CubicO group peptidase (beta-lactamase class C family)
MPTSSNLACGFDEGRFGRYLDELAADIDHRRLPGAVLCVEHRGQTRVFEALGRLRPDDETRMPLDAVFRLHSMTKPVVSAAALLLIEQGRLHAADLLTRWLPAFARTRVGLDGAAPSRPATVLDLLRHSAGFGYEFLGGPVAAVHAQALGRAYELLHSQDNASLADRLAALPLYSDPGTTFEYGRATDVLGRVLECASDRSLAQLLADAVFGPLGMVDTGFHVAAPAAQRLAQPFAVDADSGAAVVTWDACRPPRLHSGGAGLVGTAADYLRFLRALTLQPGAPRLLSRKLLQWMLADHLGTLPRAGQVLPEGWGFGLGVAVRTSVGRAPDPGSVGAWGCWACWRRLSAAAADCSTSAAFCCVAWSIWPTAWPTCCTPELCSAAGRADLGHDVGHAADRVDDLAHRRAGLVDQRRALLDALDAVAISDLISRPPRRCAAPGCAPRRPRRQSRGPARRRAPPRRRH